MWNYVHRSWEDFLVARYYFVCAKYKVIEEFGALGYLPNITAMAADLLASDPETPKEEGKYVIPAELINAARTRAREKVNLFYVCNALALAVWNRQHCTIDGASQKALIQCLEIPALLPEGTTNEDVREVTTVQRCFVLNGLAIRPIEDAANGGAAGAQLGALAGNVQEGVKLADFDLLFAHLCWCYLQAVRRFGIQAGTVACPVPYGWTGELDLRSVTQEPDARKRRSLQLALVQLVRLTAERPARSIATAHYLYVLVAVYRAGAWISQTQKLLAEVFSSGSTYRRLYGAEGGKAAEGMDADPLPQLLALFLHCESLFKSADPTTRS
jgi:hypothetical protein